MLLFRFRHNKGLVYQIASKSKEIMLVAPKYGM